MDKTTNFKRTGFFLLKIILLFAVLVLLYLHLRKSSFSFRNISLNHPFALVVAFGFIFFNWFFEFLKWKITLQRLNVEADSIQLKHSFYAGIVTGMITPNMLGNFVGRLYYFERKNRVSITLWTLISNNAQFVITIVYGILGFYLCAGDGFSITEQGKIWLPVIGVIVLLFYFFYDKVLALLSIANAKIIRRLIAQKKDNNLLLQLLTLSSIRYFIFLLQFVLVLYAFGASISLETIFLIMQYYFVLTFFPSLFLGKFIIRDSVAVMVLGGVVASNEIVLCASFSIWIMNLLLPSLFSLILLKNKKV